MISHKKKILFLGYNAIVDSVAKKLLEIGFQLRILTDAKQSKLITNSTLKDQTIKCNDENKLLDELEKNYSLGYGIGISVGCPWILNENHLASMKFNIFNLHGTQLPRDRGGTIFSWFILTGKRLGMCLLHKLVEKIDEGPIIEYEEFIYPPRCIKPIDYISYYETKNIEFLFDLLVNMYSDNYKYFEKSQPPYLSTYWPRLRADVHGWINWSWNAEEIDRFIRAFDEPYGGARCNLNGDIVIIRDAFSQKMDGYTHPFQNGLIYRNNGKWINVASNDGELIICSVINENGDNLLPELKVGDRFYTLNQKLNDSKNRVLKTKTGFKVVEEKKHEK